MFFKEKIEDMFLIKISALLVHAAKIDQNFTKDEQLIIEKTLLKLGANENKLNQIIEKSKILEENSNQILDFTREIKSLSVKEKINIVESLWKVVYSNKNADIYETNLMRRLAGLLYIDNKTMGDIKDKIKKQNL
ncbi:MAG: TerB family tellurite resistance protein [Pelagibacteraceae bacterium]|nr:TerB family tellurite resistance protein [Pelagibacteraceae bacterium]PHX89275.1 MAG: Tellurite resistance protein TerB [Pelagibacteraceae bacterium]